MPGTRIRTSSEARSKWDGQIYECRMGLEVIIDGKELDPVRCPPTDSLERRHQASDKSWVQGWLNDNADPTQPE